MKVIKRDGRVVEFDKTKIYNAIMKAMKYGSNIVKPNIASKISDDIEEFATGKDNVSISEIESEVFNRLVNEGQVLTARSYEAYRSVREFQREHNSIESETREMVSGDNEYWTTENSNKNVKEIKVQRDYMAGIVSTYIARKDLPTDVVEAHDSGVIHFHDMDYFAENAKSNCCVFNLDDMLQNGTVMNGKMIEKPHRLITATTIATQLITAVASSQYGGTTISLTHLAPFVRDSYNKYLEEVKNDVAMLNIEDRVTQNEIEAIAKQKLKKEIEDSVQTFNYQINTMFTVNGQAPFLSVFMYLGETEEYKEELAMLIEEFFKQRIQGIKNESGVYITQEFPKLLYVLEPSNINESGKYFYLTQLASKCIAKRMTPDLISEKIMLELKGDVYPCMGCRSFLTPDRFTDNGIGNIAKAKNYESGKHKYYGRWNQGVVTLNLVDVALSSNKDMDTFWSIMEDRLELCHKALKCRHNKLLNTPSDVAPILWQHGAFARLEKGEKINELMYHGYSTISLGYAGLYECVKYMTGLSHTGGYGKEFGLKVMQAMNDACAKWKAEEDIDYSVYGSPIEASVYKFAKCLKNRFGVIEGITDHDYITNSYHVNVREKIDPFEKLKIESEFQKLSPGGAISYIETADMSNNTKAVVEVMKYIYENIMYAELNTKSDYCQVCGYDGEIKIVTDDNGKLIWECPNCKNRDQDKMNVARRTCGLETI
ncbi:MAG: anaerobic ribonucleoside-triphosphate reductase [Clostridia bacterium]|nr:anaerobic ribonucleoside-triphosphate reductase [Clostridia bacterium]